VSRVCGCGTPGEAYTAGLLHDIGLLLCCRQMRRRFMQVVERLTSHSLTQDVERHVYSFDHAQLGAFVAKNWEFPDAIVDAIGHHHEVGRYTGPYRELVYVVATANYFCSRAGWTSLGVHNVALPPDDIYRILGLDQVALAIIWEELTPTLEKASYLAHV
jgi:HD-like signal output (HDOD) protein